MSIDNDLWRALYQDAVKDCATQRTLTHEQHLRVIKLEGHRRTLIAHLKWAAEDLMKRNAKTIGGRYLEVAQELEADYVEEAKGSTSIATSGRSQNQAGSGALSETASVLESPEALSVSDRSSFLPPAVHYTGNWDDCALTKRQAD